MWTTDWCLSQSHRWSRRPVWSGLRAEASKHSETLSQVTAPERSLGMRLCSCCCYCGWCMKRPTGYKNMFKKKTPGGGGYTSRAKVLNRCFSGLRPALLASFITSRFRAGGRNTYDQAASFLLLNQIRVALKTVDSCSFALSVCRPPPRSSSCVTSVLGSPSVTEVRNKLPS